MLNLKIPFSRALAAVCLLMVGLSNASRADTVINVADWSSGNTTTLVGISGAAGGQLDFTLDLRQGGDLVFGNFLMSISSPSNSNLLDLGLFAPQLPGSSAPLYGDVTGQSLSLDMFDVTTWSVSVSPEDLASGPLTIAIKPNLNPLAQDAFVTLPLLTLNLGGDLQIAAVPETSTWAMMIVGFAGVGLLAYRRRTRSAAPVAPLASASPRGRAVLAA